MVDITTPWSTTNSVYGSYNKSATIKLPEITRRPGAFRNMDIGSGRPWPALNEALLSPRVPPRWMLEPGSSPRADDIEPSANKLMASVTGNRPDMRFLAASSQRDAASTVVHTAAASRSSCS